MPIKMAKEIKEATEGFFFFLFFVIFFCDKQPQTYCLNFSTLNWVCYLRVKIVKA